MTADNMKFSRQTAIFALFSILFLWLLKGDLLYHMEQYSYFSSSGDFLVKFFEQPGGLLALLGAFLTQFCHFPVLGAVVIALSLCLLAFMVRKAFGLEGKKALLALVPSVFLLLFITRLDYTIYLQKTYGLLFSRLWGSVRPWRSLCFIAAVLRTRNSAGSWCCPLLSLGIRSLVPLP